MQIYDGDSTAAPALGVPHPWCGADSPGVITSTSEYLTVEFFSDTLENYQGFRAMYEQIGGYVVVNLHCNPLCRLPVYISVARDT